MAERAVEIRDTAQENLPKLTKAHKKLGDAFIQRLAPAVMEDGALTGREKELIAVALSINARCETCMALHLDKALDAGISKDEIAEVCGVSVLMGGGPALMYASKAMAMLDELMADR